MKCTTSKNLLPRKDIILPGREQLPDYRARRVWIILGVPLRLRVKNGIIHRSCHATDRLDGTRAVGSWKRKPLSLRRIFDILGTFPKCDEMSHTIDFFYTKE